MRCVAKVGDVFGLTGDLGAGKTQFVKGFVGGLGSAAEVTSRRSRSCTNTATGVFPFTISTSTGLSRQMPVTALGWDEYVDGDGVCIVEWAIASPNFCRRTRA
jgi:tRNA threonylcarbamoyladenosine biosynthesis protein TsaE